MWRSDSGQRYAQRHTRRHMLEVVAAVGLILLAALCSVLLLAAGTDGADKKNGWENAAVSGNMPGTAQEQLQKELNRQVSESMIAMSINSNPVFPDGASKGNIMFENPTRNGKLTQLKLYRDDTGKSIYETGLLKPGSYVAEDALDVKLDKGSYQCTALVTAYRMEDQSYIGEIAVGVTVIVEK